MNGLALLLVGIIIFFAIHAVPMRPAVRAGIAGKLGENGYKALFSLVSLLGLVLIIYGYAELRSDGDANLDLWTPPDWTRHIVFLLTLIAFVLLAAAYVPSRIRDKTGHPMLVAIKIWAFAHLLANGDLASILLFGSFLAYAVVDRISLKRRSPASGRGPIGDKTGGLTGDITAIVVGLAAYVFMLFLGHTWLIGVPLISS